MPNLIHSLDATSIAMLYKEFKNVGHIYTVHDCFAVTANNVPKLVLMLKYVYLKIYSDNEYLRKFDLHIRTYISNTLGEKRFKVDGFEIKYLNPDFQPLPFPDVNKILKLGVDSNINKSNDVKDLINSSYICV